MRPISSVVRHPAQAAGQFKVTAHVGDRYGGSTPMKTKGIDEVRRLEKHDLAALRCQQMPHLELAEIIQRPSL